MGSGSWISSARSGLQDAVRCRNGSVWAVRRGRSDRWSAPLLATTPATRRFPSGRPDESRRGLSPDTMRTRVYAFGFPWQRTRQSNGPATRSTRGGAAQRSLQRAITATPRLGQSAPATMSGDKTLDADDLATSTGGNRSDGIAPRLETAAACVSSAPRWRTSSSGIVTSTICGTGSGCSSNVRPISTGCSSRNGPSWRHCSRHGLTNGPPTSGSARPLRTSVSPISASLFC